jgi:hypothetical protein
MAEVVGGHNEVLNNEALTAHATAITAIITIKLSGEERSCVCSACRMEREDGLERIIHSLPLSLSLRLPWQRARRTPYIFSLSRSGVVATQQRSCPPDLTDNTDTLCALQPLT